MNIIYDIECIMDTIKNGVLFPKSYWGVSFIGAYVMLVISVWWLQAIDYNPVLHDVFMRKKITEMLSSIAVVLMGFGLILAARFRCLEEYFGGLDRMYNVHKVLGMMSMFLLINHFIFVPKLSEGFNIAKPLGFISLIGFIILILLTAIPKVPYHRWFPTHRFMGVFYITAIGHTFFVDNMIVEGSLFSIILRSISFLGVGCYLYKELYRERFGKKHECLIEAVNHFFGGVTELVLKPSFKFKAGQFAFISVKNGQIPPESHPFTISSGPTEEALRFTIKSLGDYTADIANKLSSGDKVIIDGPFGRFNVHDFSGPQIWIAGGIGITPFLSSLRDLEMGKNQVDLFYSVQSEKDALFVDEIQSYVKKHKGFNFHLLFSDKGERITANMIAQKIKGEFKDRRLFLCGPSSMTQALTKQAKKSGVSSIHFEKFALR